MPYALTHSSWLNAWSLRRGCAALGVDLRVAPGPARALPLPLLPAGARADWLFFTEEASLRLALADGEAAPSPAAGGGTPAGAGGGAGPQFWPRRFPLALLDDKWAFTAWLAQDPGGPQGLPQWPLADAGQARYPLLLKARHSWAGGTKLPRGWVCRNATELAARRGALAAQGLDEGWFFLQAWLGEGSGEIAGEVAAEVSDVAGPAPLLLPPPPTKPLRVLSVGGFFDARNEARNTAVLTERVADYGDAGPSSSAMLVTVPDQAGLVAQAERALRRLGYQGPYEFEFLAVARPGGLQHLALELNPRFWMQHGLFVAAGNGLVKRYLGLDSAADRALPPQRLLWADAAWLLRRLAAADGRVLRLLADWLLRRRHRLVLCPSAGFVLRAALWRAAQRLKRPR